MGVLILEDGLEVEVKILAPVVDGDPLVIRCELEPEGLAVGKTVDKLEDGEFELLFGDIDDVREWLPALVDAWDEVARGTDILELLPLILAALELEARAPVAALLAAKCLSLCVVLALTLELPPVVFDRGDRIEMP